MNARELGSALLRGAPWLRAALLGAALGLLIVSAQREGLWLALRTLGVELNARASPLWLPMLLLALRVLWLWLRALRTRFGMGALGRTARPELAKLGPALAILGVLGTLWQLDSALDALQRDTLAALLPALAATLLPALCGFALQLATRGIAARAPTWSLARITRSGERELYRLDRALLGENEAGLAALLDALAARPPEALQLDLDSLLAAERAALLHARIARTIRGPVELAPPLPGMLAPLDGLGAALA
jgi:hypothetical protein